MGQDRIPEVRIAFCKETDDETAPAYEDRKGGRAADGEPDMNRLMEEKLEQLTGVCMQHNVRTLELFGSAASGGRFEPNASDLDFLVEFGELSRGEHADAYFGLIEDLEDLFQRPVDLVMTSAIKNPYFREGIASSRVVVYAA